MVVMTIRFEAIGTVHETVLSQRLRATGKTYHQVKLAEVFLQPGGSTPPGETVQRILQPHVPHEKVLSQITYKIIQKGAPQQGCRAEQR